MTLAECIQHVHDLGLNAVCYGDESSWSTNGLKHNRFRVTVDKGEHDICSMCLTNFEKLNSDEIQWE